MNPLKAPYLKPYLRAAEQHGAAFSSLLWASPETQVARFDAIERLGKLAGKSVLDVGCGRADLVDYCAKRGIAMNDYIGIEAVPALADAAEPKLLPNGLPITLVRADFVKEPQRMFVAADVVVFSGSLNTVEDEDFYAILRRAYDAAAERVVFNYLCSPALAAASYLRWREPGDVLAFARKVSPLVETANDYLAGDCTVMIAHAAE